MVQKKQNKVVCLKFIVELMISQGSESEIGIPLVARQAYDNVVGVKIMIFTASSKITSFPIDINRLHLPPYLALNFAY